MKNRKRNITMIAVLIFVGAAVALNWSYNNRWGSPDAEMVTAEDEAMRLSFCRRPPRPKRPRRRPSTAR